MAAERVSKRFGSTPWSIPESPNFLLENQHFYIEYKYRFSRKISTSFIFVLKKLAPLTGYRCLFESTRM